jgi:hypothetical protein
MKKKTYNQIPETTQVLGALFRRQVVNNHLTKPYHTISIKLLRLFTSHNCIVNNLIN